MSRPYLGPVVTGPGHIVQAGAKARRTGQLQRCRLRYGRRDRMPDRSHTPTGWAAAAMRASAAHLDNSVPVHCCKRGQQVADIRSASIPGRDRVMSAEEVLEL